MNIPADFLITPNVADFQLRKRFLLRDNYSLLHSLCNSKSVCILTNAMRILGCHAVLNIAGLTLLKIAIALPVLCMSYIEHTRHAATSIQHRCVALAVG